MLSLVREYLSECQRQHVTPYDGFTAHLSSNAIDCDLDRAPIAAVRIFGLALSNHARRQRAPPHASSLAEAVSAQPRGRSPPAPSASAVGAASAALTLRAQRARAVAAKKKLTSTKGPTTSATRKTTTTTTTTTLVSLCLRCNTSNTTATSASPSSAPPSLASITAPANRSALRVLIDGLAAAVEESTATLVRVQLLGLPLAAVPASAGRLLRAFGRCTRLRTLHLSRSALMAELFAALTLTDPDSVRKQQQQQQQEVGASAAMVSAGGGGSGGVRGWSCFPALTELAVRGCGLDDRCTRGLQTVFCHSNSRTSLAQWQLSLRSGGDGSVQSLQTPPTAAPISGSSPRCGLERLDVSDNALGDVCLAGLVAVLGDDSRLRTLDMRGNAVTAAGLDHFFNSGVLERSSLDVVDFSRNPCYCSSSGGSSSDGPCTPLLHHHECISGGMGQLLVLRSRIEDSPAARLARRLPAQLSLQTGGHEGEAGEAGGQREHWQKHQQLQQPQQQQHQQQEGDARPMWSRQSPLPRPQPQQDQQQQQHRLRSRTLSAGRRRPASSSSSPPTRRQAAAAGVVGPARSTPSRPAAPAPAAPAPASAWAQPGQPQPYQQQQQSPSAYNGYYPLPPNTVILPLYCVPPPPPQQQQQQALSSGCCCCCCRGSVSSGRNPHGSSQGHHHHHRSHSSNNVDHHHTHTQYQQRQQQQRQHHDGNPMGTDPVTGGGSGGRFADESTINIVSAITSPDSRSLLNISGGGNGGGGGSSSGAFTAVSHTTSSRGDGGGGGRRRRGVVVPAGSGSRGSSPAGAAAGGGLRGRSHTAEGGWTHSLPARPFDSFLAASGSSEEGEKGEVVVVEGEESGNIGNIGNIERCDVLARTSTPAIGPHPRIIDGGDDDSDGNRRRDEEKSGGSKPTALTPNDGSTNGGDDDDGKTLAMAELIAERVNASLRLHLQQQSSAMERLALDLDNYELEATEKLERQQQQATTRTDAMRRELLTKVEKLVAEHRAEAAAAALARAETAAALEPLVSQARGVGGIESAERGMESRLVELMQFLMGQIEQRVRKSSSPSPNDMDEEGGWRGGDTGKLLQQQQQRQLVSGLRPSEPVRDETAKRQGLISAANSQLRTLGW